MKMFKLCLVFLIALLLLNCGKVYTERFRASSELLRDIKKIAVLPLNDLTGGENIAAVIGKLISHEMNMKYGVEVIEGDELQRLFREKKIEMDEIPNRALAQRTAESLEVDGVIYGDILEYRYRKWVTRSRGVSEDPVVSLSLRMVNGKTGTVVFSGTTVRSNYEVFTTGRDPLSAVAEMAVADLVKSMKINKK